MFHILIPKLNQSLTASFTAKGHFYQKWMKNELLFRENFLPEWIVILISYLDKEKNLQNEIAMFYQVSDFIRYTE